MTLLPTAQTPAPVSAGEEDLRQYMHEIRQIPRLSEQEELALARRCAAGDQEAIRRMVSANLRLVVSVARQHAGRGVPLLDLIQEGSIGLLVAAQKFDHTRQCRFSTYATKWIRQGVVRCIANHAELIRVPAHTAEQIRRVAQARTVLLQKNGTEPTLEQIAQLCSMTESRVEQMLQLQRHTVSLDAPASEENSMGALLADMQSLQPLDVLVRQELCATMERLLSMLDVRQQEVLRLHFGLDGESCSLEQIGGRLEISKERVRQIEKQAIEKLKKLGADMGLEDFLT